MQTARGNSLFIATPLFFSLCRFPEDSDPTKLFQVSRARRQERRADAPRRSVLQCYLFAPGETLGGVSICNCHVQRCPRAAAVLPVLSECSCSATCLRFVSKALVILSGVCARF